MENVCDSLINEILFCNHTQEEWDRVMKRFNAFMATATDSDVKKIEESGAGDMIHMICD